MKLRVRIRGQTSRVELLGEEPSLKELTDHIRDTVLSSHGLGADEAFSLSLNGSEFLTDSGQSLSSCGIVSGDLICVVLPEPAADTSTRSTNGTTSSSENQTQQTAAMTSSQTSSPAAATPETQQTSQVLDPRPWTPSWEPMLCSETEDHQAPLSLELLYHSAQTSCPSDAIMVVGHQLMLETGFLPQDSELKAGEMPKGWRSPAGVYKLQYSHPLCENSVAMVVSVWMRPLLVINATLKVNETVDAVRKLCLNPSSYVTDQWPGESAAAAFKGLNKLSRVFKDQLAYPLIAAAREAMALPVAFGLAALPPELLLRVLRLLDVGSLLRLSSVCRRFNVSTADATLWKHLFLRDFTDPHVIRTRDSDWKELYKRLYLIGRDVRRVSRHRSLPPSHRNPLDIFVPPPPLLPGIIGGEYDQRPDLPRLLLPRPRYDPVGPPLDFNGQRARMRSMGGRAADVRRGFI